MGEDIFLMINMKIRVRVNGKYYIFSISHTKMLTKRAESVHAKPCRQSCSHEF